MQADLKSLLASVEIFQGLSEPELVDIIRTAAIREVAPAEIIFDMGEPGDAMYVIQKGTVRVVQMFPDGTREILANLQAGQVFGEMAVIDGLPRTGRAIAVSPVQLFRLDRQEFNILRSSGQAAAYKVVRNIAKSLSKRLRDANRKLVQFYNDPDHSLEYLRLRRPQLH